MSRVLDALGTSVAMISITWLLIMVPSTAALAYRRGWDPAKGAACGCIPVPFAGWLVVWMATRDEHEGSGREVGRSKPNSDHDPFEVNDVEL